MIRTLLILLLFSSPLHAITAIAWNVESGGSDPAIIAKQLSELPKVDIYALQEVSAKDAGRYAAAIRNAHGDSYRHFASWTGRGDRLMISFNQDRLDLHGWKELFRFDDLELNDWNHRSPLIVRFEDCETDDLFYFVNVHLARGKAKLRQSQAKGLREWAKQIKFPAIAAGDFNFDYDINTHQGNKAFQAFTYDNVWKWAKPEKLVDTNWADRDGDGKDNYPDSMLDFAFYSGIPSGWTVTSEVIVRPGDFPDDDKTSDHRPIMVKFGAE